MLLRHVFIIPLFLLLGACSLLKEQHAPPKKFVFAKKWVRDTVEKTHLGYRYDHRMPTIVTETMVIQGNAIDGLVAYDRETGHIRWRKHFENGTPGGAQLVGDRLYFGASDGYFYALNVQTAQVIWSFPTRTETLGQPLVEDNVVYFLSGNNIAYALRASDGEKLWLYNRRDPSNFSIRSASRPTIVGDQLYLGFSDGYIVALNKASGTPHWEVLLSKNQRFRDVDSEPIVDGQRMYVTSYDGSIYCLNRTSGAVVWRVDYGSHEAVTLAGNQLYAATSDGKVLSLDKGSGKTLWEYQISSGVATRPVFYRGLVLFGESEGALRVVDARTGVSVTEFEPGRGLLAMPTVIDETGEVYFISVSANLFSLRLQRQSLVEVWPWEKN